MTEHRPKAKIAAVSDPASTPTECICCLLLIEKANQQSNRTGKERQTIGGFFPAMDSAQDICHWIEHEDLSVINGVCTLVVSKGDISTLLLLTLLLLTLMKESSTYPDVLLPPRGQACLRCLS
jgi:hypothetical protein